MSLPKLPITLEREDGAPLYEQLRIAIAEQIRDGSLAAGARLPATRRIADSLGINRSTVVEAYRRLEVDGLVEQRVGSGTYVRAPAAPPRTWPVAVTEERLSSSVRALEGPAEPTELPPATGDVVDLSGIAPDERSFPADAFAECLNAVFATRGAEVLGYGPPAGEPALRDEIVRLLGKRGLSVTRDGVLVVGGAQQGLDLLLRVIADPGDLVVTEAPTYHYALELMRFHRLEVASIPLLPGARPGESRMDFERLDALLARRPVAVFTMPTFQNPTGLCLDEASRRRLALACAQSETLLIEDDYQGDLRYEGEAVPPVSALPEAGEAAYLGTLSKALFPGLRVGWIAAPTDILEHIVRVKRVSDLSGSVLLQAAAAELLRSGGYERHLESVVAENRKRMRALSDALERCLPKGCAATSPDGGHALWLGLPDGLPSREVGAAAAERGVIVSPGDLYQSGREGGEGLRLSISRASRDDIPRAIERLCDAIKEVMARRAPASPRDLGTLNSPLRI